MARDQARLHGTIARELGVAIVSGQLGPGHVLDGEVEASSRRQVSRATYREAIRSLRAKGLVKSRTRTGTRVSVISEWNLLDPDVLAWIFAGVPRPEVLYGLFELRTIVEPEAAALAARRRQPEHLAKMRCALDAVALHTLHRPEGREADKAFHAELLAATGNPFIVSLTDGVIAAVEALTEFKLRRARCERDPVRDYVRVYDAIVAQDADAARTMMVRLIRLAALDSAKER